MPIRPEKALTDASATVMMVRTCRAGEPTGSVPGRPPVPEADLQVLRQVGDRQTEGHTVQVAGLTALPAKYGKVPALHATHCCS